MITHAFRLDPGDDLNKAIEGYVAERSLSGYVLVCVGSLSKAVLRLAGAKEYLDLLEDFEIVSMVGTLSADGCHIHTSIADSRGNMHGGHLVDGCIVRTTAEIVLAEDDRYHFSREFDEATGFDELKVKKRKS